MATIAIGGFQHETNTFAPSKADFAAFEQGGAWPPLTLGEAIVPRLAGANIPATGAFKALHAAGHRTPGLAWAAASPSAHVAASSGAWAGSAARAVRLRRNNPLILR